MRDIIRQAPVELPPFSVVLVIPELIRLARVSRVPFSVLYVTRDLTRQDLAFLSLSFVPFVI